MMVSKGFSNNLTAAREDFSTLQDFHNEEVVRRTEEVRKQLKGQIKEQKSMFDDAFENDATYHENDQKVKDITKVKNAVAIFERDNPPQMPATPSGITGQSWGFNDFTAEADKSIQDLIATKGQNDQVADRMALAALNDFRGHARH